MTDQQLKRDGFCVLRAAVSAPTVDHLLKVCTAQ